MALKVRVNPLGVERTDSQGKKYVCKGNVSVYIDGQRHPVTLYPNQWKTLLTAKAVKDINALIDDAVAKGTLSLERTTPQGETDNGMVTIG